MFDAYFSIIAFLFGAIIGSFLNALSFRFNTGLSVLRGRSKCMRCGHTLSSFDLIPLLSYAMLRGKCRYCGTKISIQYPLVELAGALLSLGVFSVEGATLHFLVAFAFWMLVLFIVVYDIRHTVIPTQCSILLGITSILYICVSGHLSLYALLAGPILAAPLLLISLLSRGTWMGWGDGWFELSFGWLLGLLPGCTALMLSIWSGAAAGIALVLYSQAPGKKTKEGFTMKSELPFAPFLALGAAAVYFFHVDLFSSLAALW